MSIKSDAWISMMAKTAGKKLADVIFDDSEFERKKKFLVNLLGARIASQYDLEQFDIFKDAAKPGYAISMYEGFTKGDHFLQDGIASAILILLGMELSG